LLRVQNVQVLQVGNFVTKAGEAFRKIRHDFSIRLKATSVCLP
jgi:hypothetical protein